jgi:Tol biopolymer transport system component
VRGFRKRVATPRAPHPPKERSAGRAAAALSAIALLVAGLITLELYRNPIPLPASRPGVTSETPTSTVVGETTEPSTAVVSSPKIAVPGTLALVKSGNLWVQSGTRATQLTDSKDGAAASQPAWSPDGQWIYYIESRTKTASWFNPDDGGAISDYTLNYPVLCRIRPDGTGRQDILSSLVKSGSLESFFWIRQPSISPDGLTAAVISDGPTGPGLVGSGDTVLHFVNLQTGQLQPALPLRENPPLGQSDPAFSPDGTKIAYVMEGRNGADGAPAIWLYDLETGKARLLADSFRGPSWSPDGKYLAATRVSGSLLDVVVLDAETGKQVGRVTYDGFSWAPVWSPAGDELVYSHLSSTVVDLYMTHVSRSGIELEFQSEPNLAEYSGLDGDSKAAWYILAPGYVSAPMTSAPAASTVPSATETAGAS